MKRKKTVLDKEAQNNLTVDEIIQQFKEGNERFLNGMSVQDSLLKQVKQTGTMGQFPKAIVLGCIDSRSPVELIFDKGIGDIFISRVAGNYADSGVIGGLEYACKVVGAKVIIVLGHTDCGAIKGACDHIEMGNLDYVIRALSPAVDSVKGFNNERTSGNSEFVKAVTIKNIHLTIDNIRKTSPILSELEKQGKIKIVPAIYDVKTGKVDFLQ